MSIVTFWNDDKEQTGKTLGAVAVATKMAIERNFKILLISTGFQEPTIKNCYFPEVTKKKNSFLGGMLKNNNIAVESGIEGLSKLIKANKIQPTIITDYTRVVFKERLEVLTSYVGAPDKSDEDNYSDYLKTTECYPELIRLANQYYDMVLVDIDNRLDKNIKKEINELANINVLMLSQRLTAIDKYNELKQKDESIIGPKTLIAIGKYNQKSKYTKKNIMRYIDEKKNINLIPYNTLFFEAAEEYSVPDFFLKLRDIKDVNDSNYFFMSEVLGLTNNIITRIQELQMKTR